MVEVASPGAECGAEADAAVTDQPNAALGLRVADCVPIMLYGVDGSGAPVVAAAHAGWRGLLAGVVDQTARRLRAHLRDDARVWAVVGPHISAARYEFEGAQRLELADRFGRRVATRTGWGTPAVDLSAACVGALAQVDIEVDHMVTTERIGTEECDAERRWFSHRAGDAERMAATIVLRATSDETSHRP